MPYEEADWRFFKGRDEETHIIISNLFAARLTTFYGSSGVGKSSVLRAGVVSKLCKRIKGSHDQGELPDLAVVYFNEWQSDVLSGHAEDVLKRLKGQIVRTVNETLGGNPKVAFNSEESLVDIIKSSTDCLDGELMLILDQFEEYFLYHPKDEGPRSFAAEFINAVNESQLPASFLLSIREDSLFALDRFKGEIPNLFSNYLRLKPLSLTAAREAIEQPLVEYNKNLPERERFSIDPELVDEIIKDVPSGRSLVRESDRSKITEKKGQAEEGIETPYLQLVLTKLWNEEVQKGSHVLTLSKYIDLGRAETIVKGHLDEVMASLSERQQSIAAGLFHYLITPSGSKIALKPEDLAAYSDFPIETIEPVLQSLSSKEQRILRSVTDNRYELFHDALAPAVSDWRERYNNEKKREEAYRQIVKEIAVKRKKLTIIGVAIILIVLIVLILYNNAKNEKLAKLEAAAAKAEAVQAKTEAEKARTLATADFLYSEGARKLLKNDFDGALKSLHEAENNYRKYKSDSKIVETFIVIGKTYAFKGDFKEARNFFSQASKIIHDLQDRRLEGLLLESLASLSEQEGLSEKALELYNHALEAYINEGDPQGSARILERLAVNEESIEKYEEAYKLYQSALDKFKVAGDQSGLARVTKALDRVKVRGFLTDIHTPKTHILAGGDIRIGRNVSGKKLNDISFSNRYISRSHIVIYRDLEVEDLRSLNGTTINGRFLRYGDSKKLSDGDILCLASTRVLQFRTIRHDPISIPPGTWAIFIDYSSKTYHYLTDKEYSLKLSKGKLSLHKGFVEGAHMLIRWTGKVDTLDVGDDWSLLTTYKATDYEYKSDLPQQTDTWIGSSDFPNYNPLQYLKLSPDHSKIIEEGPLFQVVGF